MAKVKYGGGVQDLRGSIAGQVHSRNTFGNYIRQKVSPVQPRSWRQLEARTAFTTLSRRFSFALTDEQQEAWRQAAASTPVRDVFGDSITLTGINLYCRLNSVRYWLGLDPLDDPPSLVEVPDLTNFTVTEGSSPATLTVDWNPSPIPNGFFLLIWATEPVNPGVAFVAHKLRLTYVLSPGAQAPVNFLPAYTDRFGSPTPGKAAWFAGELVHESGWKGPRYLIKARFGAS